MANRFLLLCSADPAKTSSLGERSATLNLLPKPDPSPTPLELDDWMQEKKQLQESGLLLGGESDLDPCSFSSSAFRPFTSKLSDYITLHASKRLKQQQQQKRQQQNLEAAAAAKETSCSEVSTTVDKDEPTSLAVTPQQQLQQKSQQNQRQQEFQAVSRLAVEKEKNERKLILKEATIELNFHNLCRQLFPADHAGIANCT